MPLGNSSRTNLRLAKEVTFGVVAGATGRRKIRNTGSSFSLATAFEMSKEIRSDRQTPDHILLGYNAAGSMNFELSNREYEEFMIAALQGSLVEFGSGGSATIASPTFTTSTLTQTGGSTFVNLRPGQWVRIAGITGGLVANNGVWQVSLSVAPTATVLTFEGTPFSAGSATGTVTLSAGRIENGTTQPSYLIEPEYNDVTQFQTFLGMTVNKMTLNLASRSIITGGFDFIGSSAMALTGTSNLPGTDSGSFPTAFDVLNASNNVASIYEGGAALSGTFVKSLSLEIDNGLQMQDAVGQLGLAGIRANRLSVKGKMSVYFSSSTLYNKFINNNNSSVAFRMQDSSTNGYVVSMPAVEYTAADLKVGSLDQDVMVDLDFAAKIDTVTGKMIAIDHFGT